MMVGGSVSALRRRWFAISPSRQATQKWLNSRRRCPMPALFRTIPSRSSQRSFSRSRRWPTGCSTGSGLEFPWWFLRSRWPAVRCLPISRRSNEWLIRANLVTLTATLYVCSLVNFTAIIADYNVDHSREASGKGFSVDINYLFQLGPQALPAIDRAIALRGSDPNLVSRRDCLVEQHRSDLASWRAWGFRSWRLQRTLDAQKSSTVS